MPYGWSQNALSLDCHLKLSFTMGHNDGLKAVLTPGWGGRRGVGGGVGLVLVGVCPGVGKWYEGGKTCLGGMHGSFVALLDLNWT